MRSCVALLVSGAVMLAAVEGTLASPPPVQVTPEFSVIIVDAGAGWVDTGLDVAAGEKWVLVTQGVANTGSDPFSFSSFVGPGGMLAAVPLHNCDEGCLLAGAPAYSLVGRIGGGGTGFYVGGGGRLEASAFGAGRLYLGFNDSTFGDNFGYFVVHAMRWCPGWGGEECSPPLTAGSGYPSPDRRLAPLLRLPQPNPSSGDTEVRYVLPNDGPVKLEIFDVAGRHQRTLLDQLGLAGEQRVMWNGRDDQGRLLPSGTYYARMTTNDRNETRTIVVVR